MAATNVEVPGEPTHAGTALLETATGTIQSPATATGTIQSLAPISKIHQHFCAFHFYSQDMTRQVEAHHFCSHINEDMRQCLIFDGPEANARLIGIEYIVTESLFLSLPDDEKPLWHSHEYEVKSGVLFMPGPVLRQDLVKVAKTYGKTIHFWPVDRNDPLPLGMPQLMMALTRPVDRNDPLLQLMMALTRDGQLDEGMAKDVQQRFGVDFAEERKNRSYMEGPEHGVHPLANGAGKGWRFELRETDIPPVDSVVRIFV